MLSNSVTVNVTTTADYQTSPTYIPILAAAPTAPVSLRDGLTLAQYYASQGDSVTVNLVQGTTYSLTSTPNQLFGGTGITAPVPASLSTGSIAINGNNAVVDLSQEPGVAFLNISGSANVSMGQLTIRNGTTTSSGMLTVTGSASFDATSVIFSGNSVAGTVGSGVLLGSGDSAGGDGRGGAVYIGTSGHVTFESSNFTNNSAYGGAGASSGAYAAQGGSGQGGAVAIAPYAQATVQFLHTQFTNNLAQGGATAAPGGSGDGFNPSYQPGSNYALGAGGAVYIGNQNTVTFDTDTVANNKAIGHNGTLEFWNHNGEDGGNGTGGGIYAIGATVNFVNGEVVANTATGGNGADASTHNSLAGKAGEGKGGGLYTDDVTLNVMSTLFGTNSVMAGATGLTKVGVFAGNGDPSSAVLWTNNISYGAVMGGGIFTTGGANVTLTGAQITGNTAIGRQGDNSYNNDGTAYINTGNNPVWIGEDGGSAFGGGLYITKVGGSVTLTGGTTISGNSAIGGVGGNPAASGGQAGPGDYSLSGAGGNAQGGGVDVMAGTLNVTGNTAILNNTAKAGVNPSVYFGVVSATPPTGNNYAEADPTRSGLAQGGGLYAGGGTLSLNGAVLQSNAAVGADSPSYVSTLANTRRIASFAQGGTAQGGGAYIASGLISVGIQNSSITANNATGGNGAQVIETSTPDNQIGQQYVPYAYYSAGDGGAVTGGGIYLGSAGTFSADFIAKNGAFAGVGADSFQNTAGNNGAAFGGGIAAFASTTLSSVVFSNNYAWGGSKASLTATSNTIGGLGANGGSGGLAEGGGLYQDAGSLTATNTDWDLNQALGGNGGAGYNALLEVGKDGTSGGNGGQGGNAYGGGAFVYVGVPTSISGSVFHQNVVLGGSGGLGGSGDGNSNNFSGDGGNGGVGGNGGSALGGGIAFFDEDLSTSQLADASVVNTRFVENQVGGGDGGAGGNSGFGGGGNTNGGDGLSKNYHGGDGGTAGIGGLGGSASGGGISNSAVNLTLSNSALSTNGVRGGVGGDGGIGGFGGAGQFNTAIDGTFVYSSDGGAGGKGGDGGLGGNAIGGGIAIVAGSTSIFSSSILNNTLNAGMGGDGGEGGEGGFGGPGSLEYGSGDGSDSIAPGAGGTGGAGGAGGNGGNAQGAGVYTGTDPVILQGLIRVQTINDPTVFAGKTNLVSDTVAGNEAVSGSGGHGGLAGPATGTVEQVYASTRAALSAGEQVAASAGFTLEESGLLIGGSAGVVQLLSGPAIYNDVSKELFKLSTAYKRLGAENRSKFVNFGSSDNSRGAANAQLDSQQSAALQDTVGETEVDGLEAIGSEAGANAPLDSGTSADSAGLEVVQTIVDDVLENLDLVAVQDAVNPSQLATAARSVTQQAVDLGAELITTAAALADEAPEVLLASAEGLVAAAVGPEALIAAVPGIIAGVYFAVAGAAAGLGDLIGTLDGAGGSAVATEILSIFFQPGNVQGAKYDLGQLFSYEKSTGKYNPGPAGTVNGATGSSGAATGGVYSQQGFVTGYNKTFIELVPATNLMDTIIAGNRAVNSQFTVTGYTSTPKDPDSTGFTVIVTDESGQSFSSTPLYPVLKANTTNDTTDADLAGSISSLGSNLVGVGGAVSGWAQTDHVGTATAPMNADLVVVQTDPVDVSVPLAEASGSSAALEDGQFPESFLPAYPATDQLGQQRFHTVNGNIEFDLGAVEVIGGPTFSLAGSIDTLTTTQPQVIPGFATLLAPSPLDSSVTPVVSYSIVGNDNSALFASGPFIASDGTLRYTLAPGAVGDAVISVVGNDAGRSSLPQTFSITAAGSASIEVTSSQPAGMVSAGQSVTYTTTVRVTGATGSLSSNFEVQVLLSLPDGFIPTVADVNGWHLQTEGQDGTTLLATYHAGTIGNGLAVGAVLPALTLTGSFSSAMFAPILVASDNLGGVDQVNSDANLVITNNPTQLNLNVGTSVVDQLFTSDAATFSEAPSDVLPAGLSFDPATGILTGTPAVGDGGVYSLNFTALGQPGQTYTQTFSVTIDEPLSVSISTTTPTFTVGTYQSYSYAIYQYPTSQSQQFSITGTLPKGLLFTTLNVGDAQSISIGGTPAAGTGGVYHLSLTYPGRTVPITLTVIAPNPVPVLSRISTTSAVYGSAAKTIVISGSGFTSTSVVQWNGLALTTTYVNPTALIAVIPAADFTTVGAASINVYSAGPGGGTSAARTFTVVRATPIVKVAAVSGATVTPVATVLGVNQAVVSDGTILYIYFDSKGKALGTAPTAAGKYSVQAFFSGDANYVPSISARVAYTILPQVAAPTDVTAQIKVTRSAWVYNSRTKTYSQTLTLTNTGVSLNGPISILLTNLSAPSTLVNKTGTTTVAHGATPVGTAYLTLSSSGLATNASSSVTLQFTAVSDPTFGIQILDGTGTL